MVASFHLIRYRRDRAVDGFSRMGLDRPALRRTPGLGFHRLLGTGRGASMTLGADLCRWALLATWSDEAALERFLAGSPVVARWHDAAAEAWHVRLAPLRARGTWGGRRPFGVPQSGRPAAIPEPAPCAEDPRPVAILTRATIRARSLVAFYRAAAGPSGDLARQLGVLASVGLGEWPVKRQATFSLWRSLDDARRFAHRRPAHAAVVARTRREGWYAEELFARFRPYASQGTWNGRDPLAGG